MSDFLSHDIEEIQSQLKPETSGASTSIRGGFTLGRVSERWYENSAD